jgi:hypothetical protein
MKSQHREAQLVLCSVERKSKMVIIFVPFENEQSSQVGIFKELAISLVAFLVPANDLTGLSTIILASNQHNKGNISMASYPAAIPEI